MTRDEFVQQFMKNALSSMPPEDVDPDTMNTLRQQATAAFDEAKKQAVAPSSTPAGADDEVAQARARAEFIKNYIQKNLNPGETLDSIDSFERDDLMRGAEAAFAKELSKQAELQAAQVATTDAETAKAEKKQQDAAARDARKVERLKKAAANKSAPVPPEAEVPTIDQVVAPVTPEIPATPDVPVAPVAIDAPPAAPAQTSPRQKRPKASAAPVKSRKVAPAPTQVDAPDAVATPSDAGVASPAVDAPVSTPELPTVSPDEKTRLQTLAGITPPATDVPTSPEAPVAQVEPTAVASPPTEPAPVAPVSATPTSPSVGTPAPVAAKKKPVPTVKKPVPLKAAPVSPVTAPSAASAGGPPKKPTKPKPTPAPAAGQGPSTPPASTPPVATPAPAPTGPTPDAGWAAQLPKGWRDPVQHQQAKKTDFGLRDKLRAAAQAWKNPNRIDTAPTPEDPNKYKFAKRWKELWEYLEAQNLLAESKTVAEWSSVLSQHEVGAQIAEGSAFTSISTEASDRKYTLLELFESLSEYSQFWKPHAAVSSRGNQFHGSGVEKGKAKRTTFEPIESPEGEPPMLAPGNVKAKITQQPTVTPSEPTGRFTPPDDDERAIINRIARAEKKAQTEPQGPRHTAPEGPVTPLTKFGIPQGRLPATQTPDIRNQVARDLQLKRLRDAARYQHTMDMAKAEFDAAMARQAADSKGQAGTETPTVSSTDALAPSAFVQDTPIASPRASQYTAGQDTGDSTMDSAELGSRLRKAALGLFGADKAVDISSKWEKELERHRAKKDADRLAAIKAAQSEVPLDKPQIAPDRGKLGAGMGVKSRLEETAQEQNETGQSETVAEEQSGLVLSENTVSRLRYLAGIGD